MQSTGGIDKKTGAVLSYLLWWITGIIMLFVGKNDPDVKFHAAQSIVFFGSISVIDIIVRIIDTVVGSVSLALILGLITFVIWIFGVVVWIIALLRANSGGGQRFDLPLVGGIVRPYAEQIANSV
ncbi:MAG: DUF4870 domain-containing protein [Candidatus Dormibacteraeota bacterium]|nr:DUF4870 domain-containing protein [Candidatus Dormibacteraeota bacterium]